MRTWIACAALAVTSAAYAEPPPKHCGASFVWKARLDQPIKLAGKVKSVTPTKDLPSLDIVVTTAKGDEMFTLWLDPVKAPFAVGDSITVDIRSDRGWHVVFDALIKDAKGKVLLVASGSGADDWADGWSVRTGKIVKTDGDPNAKPKSIQRTHALELRRGKTVATVMPGTCTVVKDGAQRYLVSGNAISWDGLRPPEGVDYQTFSMIPW